MRLNGDQKDAKITTGIHQVRAKVSETCFNKSAVTYHIAKAKNQSVSTRYEPGPGDIQPE